MRKKTLKLGLIALAITAGMMVAITAYAVDFKISGQINRAAMYADDGKTAKWFFVDNDNSSTRFRFTGSNDFEKGWSAGIVWEVEMQSNPSNKMDMQDNSDISNNSFGTVTFDERKMEFWLGYTLGKVWLGQGDTASNSTSEVDLSGTDVAAYSSVSDVGGGFFFQNDDVYTSYTVGSTRDNLDGLSRKDRIRYDTPTFAGFYGSASTGNGSIWDAALRYSGDFGWAKLAAAAGWADGGTRESWKSQFSSSASMLLNNGLNFTASYAWRDIDVSGWDNPYNIFAKVGYKFLEKHAASVQWSQTWNLGADGNKAPTWGVGYVFSPWESVELYGTWYLYQLKLDVGSDPDDINVFMLGGRIKF